MDVLSVRQEREHGQGYQRRLKAEAVDRRMSSEELSLTLSRVEQSLTKARCDGMTHCPSGHTPAQLLSRTNLLMYSSSRCTSDHNLYSLHRHISFKAKQRSKRALKAMQIAQPIDWPRLLQIQSPYRRQDTVLSTAVSSWFGLV